jgi:hypothetical protein
MVVSNKLTNAITDNMGKLFVPVTKVTIKRKPFFFNKQFLTLYF